MNPILILVIASVLALAVMILALLLVARLTDGRKVPVPVRSLWAGIREADVLCYSDVASDAIVRMRAGYHYLLCDKLIVRAVRRGGVIHGFGMVIAQSSDPDVTFDHKRHEQYLWLVENWMLNRGIGPKHCILMFDDLLDRVPDAPEAWR